MTRLTSTAPGATTSIWHLPAAFDACGHELSYHTRPSRWTTQADGTITLQTVGRGQEFITDADDGLRHWARNLIADSPPTTK